LASAGGKHNFKLGKAFHGSNAHPVRVLEQQGPDFAEKSRSTNFHQNQQMDNQKNRMNM
jgi:hypothetical protein